MTGLERVLYYINDLLDGKAPDTEYWDGHRVGLEAARDMIKHEIDYPDDGRSDVFKAFCAIDDARTLLKSARRISDGVIKGRIDSYVDVLDSISNNVFWLSVAYDSKNRKDKKDE